MFCEGDRVEVIVEDSNFKGRQGRVTEVFTRPNYIADMVAVILDNDITSPNELGFDFDEVRKV